MSVSYTELYPFTGPIEGYVKNFLKQQYWKVQRTLEFDDCVSEAKLTYLRLIRRLEKRQVEVKNAKHFMALFKTSWSRYYFDLANKNTKYKEVPFREFESEDINTDWLLVEQLSGYSENTGYMEILLKQAPSEVREVLSLLLNAPQEIVDLAIKAWTTNCKETTIINNAFLCKMLNHNPSEINLLDQLRTHLNTD